MIDLKSNFLLETGSIFGQAIPYPQKWGWGGGGYRAPRDLRPTRGLGINRADPGDHVPSRTRARSPKSLMVGGPGSA